MLFLSLVLIYRRWSAMRALRRRRLVCDIWERLWIISAMVGDHRRSNRIKQNSLFPAIILISSPIIADICELGWMIAGNKLFCLLRLDRRWLPSIADIWERGLRTTLARFNFHFAKRKWMEYAFYSTHGNNAICAAWHALCRMTAKILWNY